MPFRMMNNTAAARSKFEWLSQYGPCIELLQSSKVRIVSSPTEYHSTLMQHASKFSRRASVASLYLGTGPKELQLIDALHSRVGVLNQKKQKFNVCMLLDAQRGSRGMPNSRTLLKPMLQTNSPETVSLFLYHTLNLRGFLKWLLPERWNEVVGLQHMKYAVFDDDVIITGANLADSYFTNRQDRCIVIENSPELADYLCELTRHVSQFCYQAENADPDKKLQPASEAYGDPQIADPLMFKNNFSNLLSHFTENYKPKKTSTASSSSSANNSGLTRIYPLLQCGLLDLNYAVNAEVRLLSELPNDSSVVHLSSGYLNFTDSFARTIISNVNNIRYRFLVASPEANGFHDAKGASRFIPAMYVQFLRNFCRRLCRTKNASSNVDSGYVRMFEWSRPDWTFHAKGAWISVPSLLSNNNSSSTTDITNSNTIPCVTLVGSSNFGWRSAQRDMELQFAIVTDDPELQRELQRERDNLFNEKFALELDIRDRHVGATTAKTYEPPFWMRFVTHFLKGFF